MTGSLADKVALVTGGGSGIGRALCLRLAAEGARVAVVDLDRAAADSVAEEIGRQALAYGCDVSEPDRCQATVDAVVKEWEGIDLVFANAGISHRSLFHETDPRVVRQVMEVNFFGAVNTTRAALQTVLARRGSIIVTSSVAGFAPLVGRTAYAASKHALHGFFDTLRAELAGSGVRILLVCPSFVATPIHHRALDGAGRPVSRTKATVGRVMTPEEIAAKILGAVRKGQRLLLPSALGHLAWWLSRIAPRAYEWIMRRSQRSELGGA
jgi:NAD(P)-dependent dehydrogenase (short-subunit alcohol dehydrogenase family)